MNYWLMKSEPETYSIDDLANAKGQQDHWEGVRNYQARNMMRDDFRVGDQIFYYHSNCKEPGIVGIAEVVKEAYPDPTAFDPDSNYFDPKSDFDKPRWVVVDVKFVKKFPRTITLHDLRAETELSEMVVLRKGNRLSITPVTEQEWLVVNELAATIGEMS